ncbi:MAG: ABC transporter ATP-binding protein [Acidobacteriota bacterium]
MSSPVLAATGLYKSFRGTAVLRGATLALRRGETVAVAGENGSGKTTLLRIVAGLLRPDRGGIELRASFGYCPQEPELFSTLTVREHFRYFATAYGLPAGSAAGGWEARASGLLDRFRFAAWADRRVGELSGGTQQKLNLALALLHDPDLLVLDEPYAAFDWDTYLRFWDYVAEHRSRGGSLLIVSHLVHDRRQFDRVLSLDGGTLQCAANV